MRGKEGGLHGKGGGMHGKKGCVWQRGACMAGGHVWGGMCGRGSMCGGGGWQGACVACVAGETATAVDGTHPTGMHSCLLLCFLFSE